MIQFISQLPVYARIVILAVLCIYVASFTESRYRGRSILVDENHNYSPYVPPMFIAGVFLIELILDIISWHGSNGLIQFGLHVMISAIWIAVFNALLYVLIGHLRTRFNASACSMLWVALNYMYIVLFRQFAWGIYEPVLRLRIAPEVFKYCAAAYFAIAAAFFARGIVKHLRFRRSLLSGARPAEDPELVGRLDQIASELSGRKLHIDLLISPEISSPLSIGVFMKTIYVILPDAKYDYDEIDMIFRHEVIHILRQDPQTKLFMLFCCSLLWWDPLMWKSCEFCSQDIELSCDEAVLYGAADDEKRHYAQMIIESASDDRGFSTCLSARAETLRYRLRRIMEPAVDRSGIVMIAVVMLLISLASNLIAVDIPMGTVGQSSAFQRAGDNRISVNRIFASDHSQRTTEYLDIKDLTEEEKDELVQLLSELEISITEEQYRTGDLNVQVDLQYDDGWARISVRGDLLYLAGGKMYSGDHIINHPYVIRNTDKVQEIYDLLGVK